MEHLFYRTFVCWNICMRNMESLPKRTIEHTYDGTNVYIEHLYAYGELCGVCGELFKTTRQQRNNDYTVAMATDTDRKENAMSNMNIFAMLDEEAAQQIIAMYDNDDTEANHGNADDIIIGILKQLGFDKTVEAFDNLPKWYA